MGFISKTFKRVTKPFKKAFNVVGKIFSKAISWLIPTPDIPDFGTGEFDDFEKGILLNKQSPDLDISDPINQLMTSDKGCVPHDLIGEKSDLNLLYNSNIFIF